MILQICYQMCTNTQLSVNSETDETPYSENGVEGEDQGVIDVIEIVLPAEYLETLMKTLLESSKNYLIVLIFTETQVETILRGKKAEETPET